MNTAVATNWLVVLGVLLILALAPLGHAEDWTVNKKTYHNVHVIRVNPDTVSVTYDGGAGRLNLSDLTPYLQSKFKDAAAEAKAFAVVEKNTDTDPIAHLVVSLSNTCGLWTNGGWGFIGLTKTASPEEVASKWLSKYGIPNYKIIRIEQTPIFDGSVPKRKSVFTEILFQTANTDKILVLMYEGEGWSGRVYDVN